MHQRGEESARETRTTVQIPHDDYVNAPWLAAGTNRQQTPRCANSHSRARAAPREKDHPNKQCTPAPSPSSEKPRRNHFGWEAARTQRARHQAMRKSPQRRVTFLTPMKIQRPHAASEIMSLRTRKQRALQPGEDVQNHSPAPTTGRTKMREEDCYSSPRRKERRKGLVYSRLQ